MNNRHPWHLKKIKIFGAVLELPAKQNCQFSPIWPIFEVNRLNWQRCLAGSSEMAPRTLIFFQLPWVPIIDMSLFPLSIDFPKQYDRDSYKPPNTFNWLQSWYPPKVIVRFILFFVFSYKTCETRSFCHDSAWEPRIKVQPHSWGLPKQRVSERNNQTGWNETFGYLPANKRIVCSKRQRSLQGLWPEWFPCQVLHWANSTPHVWQWNGVYFSLCKNR